uniref:Uncharacterized protein n=1 Tax=Vespula pensylvanica TaxID=30213 RepID=A0A834UAY1_VESPE|nr:hypothetical protein H0235_007065 [Vespula pensylvanica]
MKIIQSNFSNQPSTFLPLWELIKIDKTRNSNGVDGDIYCDNENNSENSYLDYKTHKFQSEDRKGCLRQLNSLIFESKTAADGRRNLMVASTLPVSLSISYEELVSFQGRDNGATNREKRFAVGLIVLLVPSLDTIASYSNIEQLRGFNRS